MARRRHLVIRAFNTRPPGTTLRDQFFAAGGGDGGDGVSGLGSRRYLTRADVEAALRLEPGSDRSERLLGACFPSRQGSGGWVDAEAFVDWLEHGRTPGPPPILPARSLTLVVVRRPPRSEGASMDSSSPREPLLLPDSDNLEHPLRRRPHWRKREVVVEDRLVEYTTVSQCWLL